MGYRCGYGCGDKSPVDGVQEQHEEAAGDEASRDDGEEQRQP